MTDLDDKLRQYLLSEEDARRHGYTLPNLFFEIRAARAELQELAGWRINADLRLDRHGRRIKALEEHTGVEVEEGNTGQHQIADLQRELESQKKKLEAEENRRRDSGIWWYRQRWLWAIAAVGALLAIGVGGCATYVFSHVSIVTK